MYWILSVILSVMAALAGIVLWFLARYDQWRR